MFYSILGTLAATYLTVAIIIKYHTLPTVRVHIPIHSTGYVFVQSWNMCEIFDLNHFIPVTECRSSMNPCHTVVEIGTAIVFSHWKEEMKASVLNIVQRSSTFESVFHWGLLPVIHVYNFLFIKIVVFFLQSKSLKKKEKQN